jgi:hypothetical protein
LINKIGRTLRKAHRYLTPVFIVITILYMFVFNVPVLFKIQRILMLTMAASGAYLFFQIYYNKNKAKKKKTQK